MGQHAVGQQPAALHVAEGLDSPGVNRAAARREIRLRSLGRKIGIRRSAVGGLAVLVVAVGGCGSHVTAPQTTTAGSNTTSTHAASTAGSTTPPATADPSATTMKAKKKTVVTPGPLSGTWSGTYSAASPSNISGTFTLHWTQAGNELSGRIAISGSRTTSVTGTLNGKSIQFGAVFQGAIKYTGSVSGTSMSGSFEDLSDSLRGTWSATKSS